MKRLPKLTRAVLAACGGLLLAGALSTSAAAAASNQFHVSDIGEDQCTLYESEGQATWPITVPPYDPGVEVSGKAWTSMPFERYCLDVVNYPREVTFVAYVGDVPVARHVEPFDQNSSGGAYGGVAYDFTIAAPDGRHIDHLTVAICQVRPDASAIPHCTDPVKVYPA